MAPALDAIRRGAALGERGKIFVSSIERVVSIRTGLEDELALNAPGHVWFEAAE
jgi:nitrogen regulatory protein PII